MITSSSCTCELTKALYITLCNICFYFRDIMDSNKRELLVYFNIIYCLRIFNHLLYQRHFVFSLQFETEMLYFPIRVSSLIKTEKPREES